MIIWKYIEHTISFVASFTNAELGFYVFNHKNVIAFNRNLDYVTKTK